MSYIRTSARILFLQWLLSCVPVSATRFQHACSLARMPVVAVIRDPTTGDFVRVPGNFTEPGSGEGDDLEPPSVDPDQNRQLLRGNKSPAIYVASRTHRIQQQDINEDDLMYVRQCFCFPDVATDVPKPYCPVDKSACGIPLTLTKNNTENVGCFTNSSRTSLIRNAWPVILLWYGALLVYFAFTQQGRNARQYVVARCCNPSLNESLIQNMMDTNYERRGRWVFWRRRRQPQDAMLEELQRATTVNQLAQMTNTTSAVPTQLALKTKRYKSASPEHAGNESMADDDDDNRESCTICFAEIQEGDRVGALTCDHVFHVECLKVWLARRNVCPLCQVPNVASPRYQQQGEEDDDDDDPPPLERVEPLTLEQESQAAAERAQLPTLEVTAQTQEEGTQRRFWQFSGDEFQGRTVLHRRTHNT